MLQDYDSNAIATKTIEVEELRMVTNTFSALGGRLFQDGNQWCAMTGEDPEVGISGFSHTPMYAISKWWQEMYKPIK